MRTRPANTPATVVQRRMICQVLNIRSEGDSWMSQLIRNMHAAGCTYVERKLILHGSPRMARRFFLQGLAGPPMTTSQMT